MSAVVLVACVLVAVCVAALFICRYGNWRRHQPVVSVSVLFAWFFCVVTVLLVPIDVSRTSYMQCINSYSSPINRSNTTAPVSSLSPVERQSSQLVAGNSSTGSVTLCPRPGGYVSAGQMRALWRLVYWSSQVLTWLLLPLLQSYTSSGEFSTSRGVRAALRDNVLYYTSYVLIASVLLVYLALRPGFSLNIAHLTLIASSASNTWGLLLLVALLGHAVVALPRHLWRAADTTRCLQRLYFSTAQLSAERSDAELQLHQLIAAVLEVSRAVGQSHQLRPHVDTVLSHVPAHLLARCQRPPSVTSSVTSTRALVALHKQVLRAVHQYTRTHVLYEQLLTQVLELEDEQQNARSSGAIYRPSFARPAHWLRSLLTPKLEWWWRCVWRGYLLRCVAVLCAVLSLCLVWSEVTLFVSSPPLSLLALLMNSARRALNYPAVELISLCSILYMASCTYYAIVNVRVFNFYYLAANQQTDQHSLIFSGMLICRLTPPLCLNFLSVIHMDSHVIKDRFDETAYTQVMGHMDVLPIISDGFNIYWPMCMLVFCACTWWSVGGRVLDWLGFDQFSTGQRPAQAHEQADSTAADLLHEGQQLAACHRRRLVRQMTTRAAPPSLTTVRPRDNGGMRDGASLCGSTESLLPTELTTEQHDLPAEWHVLTDDVTLPRATDSSRYVAPSGGFFDDV